MNKSLTGIGRLKNSNFWNWPQVSILQKNIRKITPNFQNDGRVFQNFEMVFTSNYYGIGQITFISIVTTINSSTIHGR